MRKINNNMNIYIFALLAILSFVGCSKSPRNTSERYMTTQNVETVTDFPEEVNLSSPEKVKVEGVGIMGFKVLDSMIVLSLKGENGLLGFYKKDDFKPLGRFLNIGNGKGEVVFNPPISTAINFYRLPDGLYVDVFDGQKEKIYTFNVDESLHEKHGILKAELKNVSNSSFNTVRLPDGKYFIKDINNNDTQQIRAIRDLSTGKNTATAIMNRLNEASVREGEDFNIISTITRVSKDGRIIEAPIGLNYLNIYRPDGTFAKTICVGDKLDDIDDIMNTKRSKRKYTFSDVRVFDKFFGVVKIDAEESEYQSRNSKNPSILLFTLDGKPLAEIKTNRLMTSFDIDIDNGILYTFDLQSEEFLKYDISMWLRKHA